MANRQGTSPEQTAGEGGPQRRGYRYTFLSLHLPAVALGLGQGIITPVLPVFVIERFDVGIGLAALVFVTNMLGGFTASVPVGYAIDRFGRRRILLAGPIIIAASSILIGFATAGSFALLLFYRYLSGWGQQMWQLSRLTVIADTGGRDRGRQITSMFGVQRGGHLAGPLIGGFAALTWGLEVAFILHAVVVLAAFVPSFLVIRETAPPGPAAGARPSPADATHHFSWKTLLEPPIPALYAAQFLGTLTRGGAIGGGTIFLFGVYAYGTGPATLGVLSSVMAAVGIPLTVSAGFIMDRFGRKVTIVPGSIFFGFAMVYLAAVAMASWPFYAFVIGFVWMQLLASLLSGSMQTIGTDIAPTYGRGRFFGVGRMVSQAGFMANPLSFSILTALSGFTAAFSFFAGTGFAAALILAFGVKETLVRGEGDSFAERSRPATRE